MRAATSLRHDGPATARMPGSASGVVMNATPPGAATAGAITGGAPAQRRDQVAQRRAPSASPCPPARSCAAALSIVATPSIDGTCEIAAATAPSATATGTTWPPENDEPHTTMRVGSTPSSVRAKAIAAA